MMENTLNLGLMVTKNLLYLPYCIFSASNLEKRIGIRHKDKVVDLWAIILTKNQKPITDDKHIFINKSLNAFIEKGEEYHEKIVNIYNGFLDRQELNFENSHDIGTVTLHMPIEVKNYTDFYSSENHAANVGAMFRSKENPLLPNWKHMPIAYHGRASSIVESGLDVKRPLGQICNDDANPVLAPTKKLDFELEFAAIIGKNSTLGEAIKIEEAESYVFGYTLLNDWSARDIQRWEYQPLGPFLSKNFFTSISPWIIPKEALQRFKISKPIQNPKPLEYLSLENDFLYDIALEVYIEIEDKQYKISSTNTNELYWSISQQIAHHTITGCNLQVGDILASGTISGTTPNSYGSMLELSFNGQNPLILSDDHTRSFIEDYDTICIKGRANNGTESVNFGEVVNKVIP